MSTTRSKTGKFKLLRTANGNRILRLKGGLKGWYAWVQGNRGDLLVITDGNHDFDVAERKGKFAYAEFQDDPTFQDQPHLFLRKPNGRYDHLVLPEGFPTHDDPQRKLIHIDEDLKKGEVREHVTSGGLDLPISNYDNRNADDLCAIVRDLSPPELKQIRDYEEQHAQRKTVLEAVDSQL